MPTAEHPPEQVGDEPGIRFFGRFALDFARQQLSRDGEPIKLRPRTWDVLCHLVRSAGALVTKSELIDAVWVEVIVSEVTLSTSISELRAALGDDARAPTFIETVHGRGFRFIARIGSEQGATSGGACIVGREAEGVTLEGWLRSANSAERILGFVHGEAGIGKSAIVQAMIDRVDAKEDVLLGVGNCVDRPCEGESFGPILQALGHLATGAGRDRVAPALSSRAPSWLMQIPSLVAGLSTDRRTQLERETHGINPARAVRELAEALEDLATHHTIVLWLEDVHWADSGTWDVLEALSRRSTAARLLVVVSHRPPTSDPRGLELRNRKPELLVATSGRDLELRPLGHDDVAEYLGARCPGLPGEAVAALHAHTGGNPLFAACVADDLIATARSEDGSWRLDAFEEGRPLGIPSELLLLIERQFDALDGDHQALLEAASVAGTEFSSRSVAAALGQSIDAVEGVLDELVAHHGVLEPRPAQTWPVGGLCGSYAFSHALRRNAVYDRLPVSRRARYHHAIAEDLVCGQEGGVATAAAEIAGHYLAAGSSEKALFYLCRAAERAIAQGAWSQAAAQLVQAEELLASLPTGRDTDHLEVDLQLTLASLHFVRRGMGDTGARQAYERLGVLGERLGSHDLEAKSLDGIAGYHIGRAEFEDVQIFARRLIELGVRHDEPLYRMLGLAKSSCACFYQADFAACARDADATLPLYRATGSGRTEHQIDADPTTVAAVHSAVALQALGRCDEAAVRSRESLAHARALTDPFNECFALMYASYYRWFSGDWRSGLALAEDCIAMASRHGYAMQWRIARFFLELGHAELGLPTLPEAPPPEESDEESEGSQMGASGLLWCVGREHLLRGRAEDALGSANLALALAHASKSPFQNAEIFALQAGAMLGLGRPRAEAEALYAQALALSQEQQTIWVELRLLVDCAERLGLDDSRRRRLGELAAHFDAFESPLCARAEVLAAA